MKRTLCRKLFILALALALSHSEMAQTGGSASTPCVVGYTVGFFNGVWNTRVQASDGLVSLQEAVREATGSTNDFFNLEDVKYELFYNETGSGAVAGHSLQDIAEVFEQRANELDPSGNLANDAFYMFWDTINGDTAFHQPLSDASPDFLSLYNNFVGDETAAAAAAVAARLSLPPTAPDYSMQQAQLTADANAGRMLLLVAHSQGNLFVNKAYEFIQPKVADQQIAVVHIAPASTKTYGRYVLSDTDLVINALRLFGGVDSVPSNNITILPSVFDLSGHTLTGTYLATSSLRSNGRNAVEEDLLDTILDLTSPALCNAIVSPSTSFVTPGGSVSLTATVSPPIVDPALTILYTWTTTGAGTFSGGTPTSPNVTYTSSSNVTSLTYDYVYALISIASNPNDPATVREVGNGAATVTVQPPPPPPQYR